MIVRWLPANQRFAITASQDVHSALVSVGGTFFWATRAELESDLARAGLAVDVTNQQPIEGAKVVSR